MSTSHLPRDKKDRSVRARKHDPYKTKGKPRESSVCRECKAVYHKKKIEEITLRLDPAAQNRISGLIH